VLGALNWASALENSLKAHPELFVAHSNGAAYALQANIFPHKASQHALESVRDKMEEDAMEVSPRASATTGKVKEHSLEAMEEAVEERRLVCVSLFSCLRYGTH